MDNALHDPHHIPLVDTGTVNEGEYNFLTDLTQEINFEFGPFEDASIDEAQGRQAYVIFRELRGTIVG